MAPAGGFDRAFPRLFLHRVGNLRSHLLSHALVIILLSISSPKRAGMLFYFFIGFLAGFAGAIVIGVKTNATGWKSAVLISLPFLGALIALLYRRKTDYLSWPIFGFRYKL